jgi:hypothetical protein
MKVAPLTETVRFLNSVHEKKESGDNGSQSGNQHQQNQEKSEENPEVFEVSELKVGAAIDAFRADAQAQANGLNAQAQGQGPGLRVILKDGSGAVVRQFTGEEFLKLRQAVSDGRVRGKILDQKV